MLLLRTSCLMLEMKRFRCYEVKIVQSEKVNSFQELNSGCYILPHDGKRFVNVMKQNYRKVKWLAAIGNRIQDTLLDLVLTP